MNLRLIVRLAAAVIAATVMAKPMIVVIMTGCKNPQILHLKRMGSIAVGVRMDLGTNRIARHQRQQQQREHKHAGGPAQPEE